MAHPVWGRPTALAEIRLGLEDRGNQKFAVAPIDTFIVCVMVYPDVYAAEADY